MVLTFIVEQPKCIFWVFPIRNVTVTVRMYILFLQIDVCSMSPRDDDRYVRRYAYCSKGGVQSMGTWWVGYEEWSCQVVVSKAKKPQGPYVSVVKGPIYPIKCHQFLRDFLSSSESWPFLYSYFCGMISYKSVHNLFDHVVCNCVSSLSWGIMTKYGTKEKQRPVISEFLH